MEVELLPVLLRPGEVRMRELHVLPVGLRPRPRPPRAEDEHAVLGAARVLHLEIFLKEISVEYYNDIGFLIKERKKELYDLLSEMTFIIEVQYLIMELGQSLNSNFFEIFKRKFAIFAQN